MGYTDYVESFNFTQTQPSDGTTIHVSAKWTLGPLSSDALEIYCGFDSNDALPGPPRLTVLPPDTKTPVNLTISSLGKPAILYMWLAPRLINSENNEAEQVMPDTEDDDHEWDLYAARYSATISYTPIAAPTPVTTVTAVSYPKTLKAPNHFVITCSASGGTVDDFNLMPTQNGTVLEQLESKHGSFQETSSPGDHFLFSGQAHNQYGWGKWSAPQPFTATPNLHSVAVFLTQSGVSLKPPVWLKQYLAQSKSATVRAMLGI
jgi:hypothetical protein